MNLEELTDEQLKTLMGCAAEIMNKRKRESIGAALNEFCRAAQKLNDVCNGYGFFCLHEEHINPANLTADIFDYC